jgi:hypothetical protein
MDKFKLSPLELNSSHPLRRAMPRPKNLRQPDYEEKFDFQTIFYDCFASADAGWSIFLGPPLLNLEPIVLPALPALFNCNSHCDVLLRDISACTQLWLRTAETRADLPPGVFRQDEISIRPNQCELFRDRKVLLTKSKDNDLCWIHDWVHFFARKHGSDAVLFYDNASTKYDIFKVRETILSIPGIEVAVVVHWPYKFGPVGSESFHGPQGLPWDSTYSQLCILEHARHRFLTQAEAVVNADVDELMLTENNASIFELIRRSRTGYLEYPGRWIESATESTGQNLRHCDFLYRSATATEIAEPKWTVAPCRCPPDAQWLVHNVTVMQPDALSTKVSFRHFRGISTGWKYPRGKLERPNERDHVRDDELVTWMGIFQLSKQEAWAKDLVTRLKRRDDEVKDLTSRLEERECEVKVLTANLKAQEATLRGVIESTTWRMTKPIRQVSYLFHRMASIIRVIMKRFSVGHNVQTLSKT